MLKTPKLHLDEFGEGYEDDKWSFCAGAMNDLFGLPDDTIAIQIRGYREDGPNRFKVELERHKEYGFSGFATVDTDEGTNYEYLLSNTVDEIVKLAGKKRKTWYIEVDYWVWT